MNVWILVGLSLIGEWGHSFYNVNKLTLLFDYTFGLFILILCSFCTLYLICVFLEIKYLKQFNVKSNDTNEERSLLSLIENNAFKDIFECVVYGFFSLNDKDKVWFSNCNL